MNSTPPSPEANRQPASAAGLRAASGSDVRPKTRASDKSVRDRAVTVRLTNGQIVVENKTCGILFSFPAACWPDDSLSAHQRMWVNRLTPWWDMEQPQWSPTSQRLRDSCLAAIRKLFPTEQPLNDPSATVGRDASEGASAALPGNQSKTNGVLRHPNAALCDPAHGDAGKPKTL
jgi:hypothetical protein